MSAPTGNILRVQAAEKRRLAAFSVARIAPLSGLPAAWRGLFSAPLDIEDVTGGGA